MLISEREVFNGSSDLQTQYYDFTNAELRLYRVKRGIQSILGHTQGRPKVRKRIRKTKSDQLFLF